ncbi:hypothetical protein V491_08564, partial [Pseudogymnoascus sp. VKM F-3775]
NCLILIPASLRSLISTASPTRQHHTTNTTTHP